MVEIKIICPYDGNPAIWVENSIIYKRNYGKSYMCWYCPKCGAYVGCHQNSMTPLGTLANAELRKLRQEAHRHIDPYWMSGKLSRGVVYAILSEHFGLQIHIGEADEETCKQIIELDIMELKRKEYENSK